MRLAPETCRAILENPWPGNLRELKLCLQLGAARRQRGVLLPEDLGVAGTDTPVAGSNRQKAAQDVLVGEVLAGRIALSQLLQELENKVIAEALQRTGGRLRETARLLKVSESSLRSKLKKRSPGVAGELVSRKGERLLPARALD